MARQYTLPRPTPVTTARIDFPAELNPQQCAAVMAPPGPALVIAGAGSGKTRTLTYRVAFLVENGIPPSAILLLTFTNKAAREMLDRVAGLLPHDLSALWGGTFHSIGNRLLRRHPQAAGFQPGFSIMDREDQQDLLDSVLATREERDKLFPKGEVLADIFSFALNTGRSIEDVLVQKYPSFLDYAEPIAKMQQLYDEKKRTANVVDFDDLLQKPLQMLRDNPPLAERYQQQFQFVLVDEYQDTNHLQADFIDILAAKHRNITVVGDDAQAIYSWRGADFKNILEFPQRYPGAQVYKIETNYRSIPEILEVANAAIAPNTQQFRKELVSSRKSGLKPGLVPLQDGNQQAYFVTRRILDLQDEGIGLDEIAVLYRSHFHSMELQMELTRHGVPFQITSGLRFFEQAHVKDVAAFLKFAVNPRDEVAFKRMARLLPGIGARTAEGLWNGVAKALLDHPLEPEQGTIPNFHEFLAGLTVPARSRKAWEQLGHTLEEIAPGGQPVPPSQMINTVIEAVYDDFARSNFSNYDQRREDLNTLANFARQFPQTSDFLDQLALISSLESETVAQEEEVETVTLSSVHQAKGLEWKAVFVIWMSDGMFPSARSLASEENIEEERRLFYVAITRAKDQLYLTYPLMRSMGGPGDPRQRPSRFLYDVPIELMEEWQVDSPDSFW